MKWLRKILFAAVVSVIDIARSALSAVLLIVFIVAVANYVPLLNTHSDQDNCAFGPVSNDQYRAYLAEAKNRQRTKWPSFNSDSQDIQRQLNFRLSDMTGDEPSLYARLAIMHAILRALGAEYLNTNSDRDADPYEADEQRRQYIRFNYQVDINRLFFSAVPQAGLDLSQSRYTHRYYEGLWEAKFHCACSRVP